MAIFSNKPPHVAAVGVCKHFGINRSQATVDFVDIDAHGDVALFIDPQALRTTPGDMAAECVFYLRSFFQTVIDAIRAGRDFEALSLLAKLSEPNETHLGLSQGRPRGRGIGRGFASTLLAALKTSEAVKTGLLEDLDETLLLVEGVGPDLVSDITTNVIRPILIKYTQDACERYGIPVVPDVVSGNIWDPAARRWTNGFHTPLPMVNDRKLLLVPKVFARRALAYDAGEFYREYILEDLEEAEFKSANRELVRVLRNGDERIYRKDLRAKYGDKRADVAREVLKNPGALERYKKDKVVEEKGAPTDLVLSEIIGRPEPNYDALLAAVRKVPPGTKHAKAYHEAVEQLLTALFYPALSFPKVEYALHNGRKRLDIKYTNVAMSGFFGWVRQITKSVIVPVECKNYATDIANPELDQMLGRFSERRGDVGIIVCRAFDNKKLFLDRCRDAALDGRGHVIVLDDADLASLVKARSAYSTSIEFDLLVERITQLIT